MGRQFSALLRFGTRGIRRGFGELKHELSVLFTSFPQLDEAFDADGLPVSFIIERDARGAQVEGLAPPARRRGNARSERAQSSGRTVSGRRSS
jgi:hypothetical protein